jgi:maltose 6'-phosphate phosphatase
MKVKLLALMLTMFLGLTGLGFAFPQNAACNTTSFKILTINLLFSEINERSQRLARIADFVKSTWGSTATVPVDVILLQEVVGGTLVGTDNSAQDLQNLLATRGLTYYLNYHLEEALPILFTQGIAILSRHPIVASLAVTLPNVEVVNFLGFQVNLRRIALLNRIDIANYGQVNIYNTHLCSSCDPSGRAQQVGALLNFIQTTEQSYPGGSQIILGGDFNIDLFYANQRPAYQSILSNGFMDTYAGVHHVEFTCCDPNSGGTCCTFAVPGNPYAFDLTGQPESPARLDYLFIKGKGMQVRDSQVVFNSGDWVSDHSGVVTELQLGPGVPITGPLNLLLLD